MKSLVLFFMMTVALGWAQEESPKGITLTITLENVLNDQGDILAALHTQDTFMKGPGIANYKAEAQKGQMTFTFDNVAPGTYGVSVLHDLNSNQRMDYQSNGMPDEPYGMSGNDMSMGPPSFDSVSFVVGTGDQDIAIRF
ncbi:MAG: DUF2141 domain-containing protein [Robiginitalea sp.]|uniref:DUF2141 domain-containing protein n=1 Tax=Robiginitalea sp. TaxID=1902411 RepID=UPI003C74D358